MKEIGLVVKICRTRDFCFVTLPSSYWNGVDVCYRQLRRAGLKPLKMGEKRKVRITITEVR